MSEEITGDSTAENVVEMPQSGLDLAGLTASIKASKVEAEAPETPVESETVEESTEEEAVQETTAEATEEVNEEVTEEVEEEFESEEENEADVLLKKERAIHKLTNRNKKLTKNWRTAEEKIESLEQRIEELASKSSSEPTEQPQGFKDKIQATSNLEELQALYDQALKIEENAEAIIDQMDESGDDEIELQGTMVSKDDIKRQKRDAQKALRSGFTERAQMFQDREQYDNVAIESFDFLQDAESEYHKKASEFMSDKGLSKFLEGRSDQLYILGLMVEGQRALDARSKQQSSQEKGKTEDTPAKAKPTPKIAPRVSGTQSGAAPARATGQQKTQQKREELLSRKQLDASGLASLIASSKT